MGKEMRKYTKGKGKKWKKGESSSSNPSTNTHRNFAKQSFFQYKLGTERDTKRPIFDKMSPLSENDIDMDTSDAKSSASALTTDTFKSNVSSWTQCSIASFSRLQSIWSTNSVLHREMLAILAAITEVIKEKNGKETETEYFAALLATLESVESSESRTAVLALLGLLIKRISPNVLKKQCSQIVKPLMKLLSDNVASENNALMRSILKCITTVLRAQELAVWKEASTEMVYRSILSLLNHHKPKVRKQCQNCVCSILKGSDIMTASNPPPMHPMAVITAEQCVQLMEDSRVSSDSSVTLHVLGLLKDILGEFPQETLRQTVEAVFRCILLANPLVSTVGLKALNGLFVSHPPASRLDFEMNSQLINALYDFQPTADDSQLVMPWLETMKQAHLNLYRLDQEALLHLPRLSITCMKLLLSDKAEIREAAVNVIKETIASCVRPSVDDAIAYQKYLPQLQRFFLNVENGLTYQYHAVWDLVLQCLAAMYEVCGRYGSNFMIKSLEKLADLRSSLQFPFKSDLDYAFSRAVRRIGAPKVLRAVPLQMDLSQTPMDLSRSWVIPILRDHTMDTELGFFTTHFLPLASQLRTKSAALLSAGEVAEAKSCDVLQSQIWSLLPGFCIRPVDLVQNFKGIAKILGQALDERPDLHLDVMAALRNLVTKHVETDLDRAEVAKYAKNYVPRLFQLYTLETPEASRVRLAALETVKVYLNIAPAELITELLDKVLEKLAAADSSTFLQQACVDLAAVLLPFSSESKLDAIFEYCKTAWSNTDHTLQKKGYRCLEELLLAQQTATRAYITKNSSAIKSTLLEVGSFINAAAKGSRLRCLLLVVRQNGAPDPHFMKNIFAEVVLSTKEVADKSRKAAFELIREIGNIMLHNRTKTENENISEYFELLLSGFAGSTEAISASMLAISHAVHEFHNSIPKELLEILMQNVILLLGSNVREIIQSVFGFLKVILSSFTDVQVGSHIPKLIKGISGLNDNLRRHFRTKIKDLFTGLIRKFGYAMIIDLVPEDDAKLLQNIRKTEDRKKRQKKEKREIMSEERKSRRGSVSGQSRAETVNDILDELASTDEEPEVQDKHIKKSKVYIADDNEEDIVDFTDPKASQKISASRHEKINKRKVPDFQLTADGKIIIPDDDNHGPMDDTRSLSSGMSGLSLKRKKDAAVQEDQDDLEENGDTFKYKAGGSGIHRALKGSKKDIRQKRTASGADYKAKKAGGDVKLKGRPDPYAYIPLNSKAMNHRKRAKLSGQFKGIVKGARKGAMKGGKMRKRRDKTL